MTFFVLSSSLRVNRVGRNGGGNKNMKRGPALSSTAIHCSDNELSSEILLVWGGVPSSLSPFTSWEPTNSAHMYHIPLVLPSLPTVKSIAGSKRQSTMTCTGESTSSAVPSSGDTIRRALFLFLLLPGMLLQSGASATAHTRGGPLPVLCFIVEFLTVRAKGSGDVDSGDHGTN